MTTKHDFCPGCGAQVYPEETQCPFCGRSLRTRLMVPVVVGLAGLVVALVSGGLVWWVLSSPPAATDTPPQITAAAPPAVSPPAAPIPAVSAPAAPLAAATRPSPAPAVQQLAEPASNPMALAPVAPPAGDFPPPMLPVAPAAPADAAAGPSAKDQAAFVPPSRGVPAGADAAAPTVVNVPPAVPAPAASAPGGDAESRRAFAKSKQDSFAQNGLDLQVTTTGARDTTLVIRFNFSAKTAAELIVAGPFPKQCEQRGFTDILFVDPTGTTWVYDIATQQMTQK